MTQPDLERGFGPFFALDTEARLQVFFVVEVLVDMITLLRNKKILEGIEE